jgi:hypothetical protein
VPVPDDPTRSAEDTAKLIKASHKLAANRAILKIFDQKKLRRLLRHPDKRSHNTRELVLGGEFLRTDGVQIQFYCGLKAGIKRDRHGVDLTDTADDDHAVAPDCGINYDPETDEADIISDQTPTPSDVEDLYACDPGKTNLYTVVKARRIDEAERLSKHPDLAPLGDGTYVVWEKVSLPPTRPGKYNKRYLTKSAKEYDVECGSQSRRLQRKAWINDGDETSVDYKAAIAALSTASLSCVDAVEVARRVVLHMRCHAPIHMLEGSLTMAHARLDAFIGKQKTLAGIVRDFKMTLGENGILAWGGARWAVCGKGAPPCRSNMIFRHLKKVKGLGNRIVTEAETNTSCKSSIGLYDAKMTHPKHKHYCAERMCYTTTFAADGSVISRIPIGKFRVGVLGGGSPHGLFLCNEGMKRTCSRDINGASNIWRAYWERCHGRERPQTLRSSRIQNLSDSSDAGRSAASYS